MYLFLDSETTGLPKNWKLPVSDLKNWPRVVQIAWARYDGKDRHLGTKSFIVRPEGFTIPREAQRVHGISTAKALTEGKPLKTVLKALAEACKEAKLVIAHNMQFDSKVIGAEFLRQGLRIPFLNKSLFCTMIETTGYCRLPGRYGYKWPTLAELHEVLFGEDFEEGHDAMADVAACAKCFFELKKRRILKGRSKRA